MRLQWIRIQIYFSRYVRLVSGFLEKFVKKIKKPILFVLPKMVDKQSDDK